MKKLWILLIFLVTALLVGTGVFAGWEDKMSGINLTTDNRADFPEIGAPGGNPDTNHGWLYVKDNSGTSALYFENDAGTVTNIETASTTAWSSIANPTADKTITFDNDEITVLSFADVNEDMLTIKGVGAFGDVSVMRVEQSTGAATDGTVLEVVSADANVDPLVVSSSAQAGVLKVAQDGTVAIVGATGITGDVTITGDLTQTGTFYQSALASAASGNTSLTIDAAGTGTITLGGTSTGLITTDNVVQLYGNTDIGNAASDTLTITSVIDGNVTLYDAVTDSPSLILKDATAETGILLKSDAANVTLTTSAAEGLEIVTGNLFVGNGSPGTAAMDGEDFYVNGDSEFDGAIQADGAVTCASTLAVTGTTALSENVTFTMAADEYLLLDAATTPMTQTAGALDINLITGATAVSAVLIDVEAENTFANAYGIYINVDDDATGGEETIDCIYLANSEGTASTVNGIQMANTLDVGIDAVMAAAGQFMVVDATTAANTGTSGVLDINYRTATTTAHAINLDVESDVAGGASEVVYGLKIQLDDDANTASDSLSAIYVGTDGDATGLQYGLHVVGAGIDYAVYAQNGAVRIGTGTTPGQTIGDDTLFVEGLAEIDGVLYPDGGITGLGTASVAVGLARKHESYTGAGNTITIAESGTVFDNTGDADGSLHTLPEASTAIGCYYTFIVTANQNMIIELDDADVFLHLTLDAGDQIQSTTVGDSITVVALDATNWGVVSAYPLAGDWADGGA